MQAPKGTTLLLPIHIQDACVQLPAFCLDPIEQTNKVQTTVLTLANDTDSYVHLAGVGAAADPTASHGNSAWKSVKND